MVEETAADIVEVALQAFDDRIKSAQTHIEQLEITNVAGWRYSQIAELDLRLETLRRDVAECKASVKSILEWRHRPSRPTRSRPWTDTRDDTPATP